MITGDIARCLTSASAPRARPNAWLSAARIEKLLDRVEVIPCPLGDLFPRELHELVPLATEQTEARPGLRDEGIEAVEHRLHDLLDLLEPVARDQLLGQGGVLAGDVGLLPVPRQEDRVEMVDRLMHFCARFCAHNRDRFLAPFRDRGALPFYSGSFWYCFGSLCISCSSRFLYYRNFFGNYRNCRKKTNYCVSAFRPG